VKRTTNIFVVDSGNLFVSMLGYIFTKNEEYSFNGYETGEECLRNLSSQPALIILDYSLPAMNGYETLLEIKEQDPMVHVIALVSADDPVLPSELLAAGADDYVLKEESNFAGRIVEKVELFLNRHAELNKSKSKFPSRKLYYYILIILLVSAGVYYYQ
jgi:two-component system, OmpR family, response regulator